MTTWTSRNIAVVTTVVLTSASISPSPKCSLWSPWSIVAGWALVPSNREKKWVCGGYVVQRIKFLFVFFCFFNVRWLCPRIQLSVLGKGEVGSSWFHCSFHSQRGQIHFPACTDFAPGACPHSFQEVEAFPDISASVDAVWRGSPHRGSVFFLSALA